MVSKTGLDIDTVERFSGQYALISKRGKAQRRVDYHTRQADGSWEMFDHLPKILTTSTN